MKASINLKQRNINYYNLENVFDNLYAESEKGSNFKNLMDIISCPENIRLAYRNIKNNDGSHTAGVDQFTIEDVANDDIDSYISSIQELLKNYQPRPVKRVEIPKPDGTLRPLGIPCIVDRIVQQCILQVLEPICEAKFYKHSYGFRPNRNCEHAIADCARLMNKCHMSYVVNFDIKGFFDNVNHKKLLRQLWSLGIKDTKLIQIIKCILKAPIILPNGNKIFPSKGTPQGGILSPLLANVVLNELDWWIDSQWCGFHKVMQDKIKPIYNKQGTQVLSNEYKNLRKHNNLKEIYIVRYADDFKIFCKNYNSAKRIMVATIDWLKHRLQLEVSTSKTGISNLKKQSSEFLGFRMKLKKKGKVKGKHKYVAMTHVCDKAAKRVKVKLCKQIKSIQRSNGKGTWTKINKYNSMVIGIQNYYQIATHCNIDFRKIQYCLSIVMHNRLQNRLKNNGEQVWKYEYLKNRFSDSSLVVWLEGIPIVPIGYIQTKNAMNYNTKINQYTPSGRVLIHSKSPAINYRIVSYLGTHPVLNRTVEYNDNRISLYCQQRGKCAITKTDLQIGNMHCHHIVPKQLGGNDKFKNLVLVTNEVHKLIHATNINTIQKYLSLINPDEKMTNKINKLRKKAELQPIKR